MHLIILGSLLLESLNRRSFVVQEYKGRYLSKLQSSPQLINMSQLSWTAPVEKKWSQYMAYIFKN